MQFKIEFTYFFLVAQIYISSYMAIFCRLYYKIKLKFTQEIELELCN